MNWLNEPNQWELKAVLSLIFMDVGFNLSSCKFILEFVKAINSERGYLERNSIRKAMIVKHNCNIMRDGKY